MAFFIASALACLSLAAGFPAHHSHHGSLGGDLSRGAACPRAPFPEFEPIVLKSVLPSPVSFGSQTPAVIEHQAAPLELNYFEKPWVVKHKKGAALNVYTQTPVVVDEYKAPEFRELPGPPAVVVQEVAPAAASAAAATPATPAAPAAGAPEYGVWDESAAWASAAAGHGSWDAHAAPAPAPPSCSC